MVKAYLDIKSHLAFEKHNVISKNDTLVMMWFTHHQKFETHVTIAYEIEISSLLVHCNLLAIANKKHVSNGYA